jgi:hypothetical protein
MSGSCLTGHRSQVSNFEDGIQTTQRILIRTGSAQAWFYPSKGLNQLFSQAGKPKVSGTKPQTSGVNPKPRQLSSPQMQQRRTYVEVLRMEAKGHKGKGQLEERAVEGDRSKTNNSASLNIIDGRDNASRRGPPPPQHPNQYGYNPGHDWGRAYGGYARGWQRQPHRGYRYGGSRFTASSSRSGSDQQGQNEQIGNMGAQQAAVNTGAASQQSSQLEPPVPEVFKTQKAGKAKIDEGQPPKGKEKPFCFRCYKPGHGKLDFTTKLHCDICDSHDHLTGKCPILKQPRLLVHPCRYDVSSLGFYHIPHAPYSLGKTNNTRALVTVQGGELSIPQLVAELCRLIQERWLWNVTQQYKNSFMVPFPSRGGLTKVCGVWEGRHQGAWCVSFI